MAAVDRNGHGIEVEESLPPVTRATEALVMGLRLTEGVDLTRVSTLAQGREMVNHTAVATLAQQGLVRLDDERLIVTDAGALLLDAILREVVL
jgi:oxygen-independent coproporphyrinogen-3 oxidase